MAERVKKTTRFHRSTVGIVCWGIFVIEILAQTQLMAWGCHQKLYGIVAVKKTSYCIENAAINDACSGLYVWRI